MRAMFRSEPGETASNRAISQLCSSAVNYLQFQTTTCGAPAIFLHLQMCWLTGILDFWKLGGMLTLCQKLEKKKCLKKPLQNQKTQTNPKPTKFCMCKFALILEEICCCQTQGSEGLFSTGLRLLLCISRVSLQHM